MEKALELLGSFARFVKEKEPELASKLTGLAMQWAAREGIPMHSLAIAMREPEEQEAD